MTGLGEKAEQLDSTGYTLGTDDNNLIGGHQYVASYAGNDFVVTTINNDVVIAGAGNDVVNTGDGDDVVYAGVNEGSADDNDVVFTGEGSDKIYAGAGDDIIFSSSPMNGAYYDIINHLKTEEQQKADDKANLLAHQRAYSNLFFKNIKYDSLAEISHSPSYYFGDSYHLLPSVNSYYWATAKNNRPVNFFYNVYALTNHGESYAGADIVYAGVGNDVVVGSSDTDSLYGEQGNDALYGLSGNDLLDGGEGDDELVGGDGLDILVGGAGKDRISGGLEHDKLYGGVGNDVLNGDLSLLRNTGDYPTGTPFERFGDDYLDGGVGDDILVGNGGHDRLYGSEGDDKLQGDYKDLDGQYHGNDILDGGIGNDKLRGDGGNDTLYGGEGDDELQGDSSDLDGQYHGDDALDGGKGNDRLWGDGGNDILYGGEGNDKLMGDNSLMSDEYHGNDILFGGAGNDSLWGQGGQDKLYGGEGNDYLDGDHEAVDGQYHGGDYLEGGQGNDSILGSGGNDHIDGGEGDDFLVGDKKELDGRYHGNDVLYGGEGVDRIFGQGGQDTLYGGAGDDILNGDALDIDSAYHGDDILYGGEGNDTLLGQGGNDILYGGTGNDYLDSGNGDSDVLYGESGDDILIGGGRLESGEGEDYYNITQKAVVKDSDGRGFLFFKGKQLNGANVFIKSDTLDKPDILDFSQQGYILNDTSADRLQEVERSENYIRYIVNGDNNFVYKNQLNTEGLTSGNLGIKFYVTVYKDSDNQDYMDDPDPFGTQIQHPFTGFLPLPSLVGYQPFLGNPPVNLPPFAPPKNPPALSDPLVLDLNHNGKIDTIHLSRGVNFDLDGNRFAEQTSWVNGDDGFVVLDLNNNGRIDNGGELFGTDTLIQGTSNKARNGFIALAQYDNNQDGLISTDDEMYKHLKIWQDKNQDGISQSDELKTLEEHGIIDIGLSKQYENTVDDNQVLHTYQGVFNQTITTSQIQNNATINTIIPKQGIAKTLLFQVNISNTKWQVNEDDVGISDEVKALPNLLGYGTVKFLHHAISEDTTGQLKSLIAQFNTATFENQSTIAEQILIHWTGKTNEAKGVPVEGRINLQQLGVLKALWGKEQEWRNVGLNRFAKGVLENAYQDTLKSLHAGLLTQTHHKSWVQMIDFKINEHIYKGVTEKVYQADFSLLIKRLVDIYKKDADYGENLINELDFTIKYLDINHSQLYNDWLQQFSWFVKETELENLTALLLEKDNATIYNDIIVATDQNDVVNTQGGNDVIIGGKGDDELQGGIGSDTYVFSLGDGKDMILNYDESFSKLDTIYFTQDINPNQVQAKREDGHLILQYSSEDSITVKDFFDSNGAADYRIDQIQFAGGAIWDIEYLLDKVRQATIGDDKIYGYDNQPDVLEGKEGNDTLYGNAGDDTLDGGSGNDILDGGLGADRLLGGADNDTYHVNESGDEVIENAKEGEDIVISEIDHTLTQNVENLTLTNNQQAITATGNNLNNILTGNTFNNILDGRAGIDTMIGGLGDDTYYVDNTLDIIIEKTGEGYDSVIASSDYTLSEHVENLTLIGDAIVAIGNDLDNILIGNEKFNRLDGGHGDDTLDGGLGADTMIGGLGADTYHVDNALDVIIELPNKGYDTIISQVDYTLVKNVERLILEAGSNATHATGNELDNHIIGNETDNVIDGGMGADLMDGGHGDDYYVVDNEFDNVVEQFDGGIDTVEQHIDRSFYNFDEFGNPIKTGSYHQLFDNVENLILKSTAKTAFGNDLDNIITLNNKDNFVNALAGNDTIIYQKGGGRDTILSNDSLESKDTLAIHGYDLSEAMFVRVTNTASNHDMLQIRFKGSNDQITLIDYFAEQVGEFDNRMDEITFTKGGNTTTLSQSEFEAKIFAQANNHAPWVNKHPRPIKGEIDKALSITFDKDTIKDVDAYDSELSYRLTLASMGADGQYEPLPDWLSFDPSTLTLTGTPPKEAAGNLQFILWGEDSFNHSAGTYVNLSIAGATVDKPTETSPLAPVAIGDTIKDTQGNDTLRGTTADNTFVYTKGIDTIIDKGGNDTLVFGNGITFNQVGSTLLMSGNDLILRVNGSTTNQVTLKDFFGSADSVIETIKFETGGQIDYKRIYELFGKKVPTKSDESALPPAVSPDVHDNAPLTISKDNHIIADARANKLYGTDGHDQLQGLAGADTLDGKAGHDILIGGSGNDRLIGGSGNDLYYFTKGFGKDTIINTGGGYDNIYFDGISFNQVGRGLTKMNNDLILKVSGSTDELTIKDFFTGGDNADINISFADGGSISATELLGLFKSSKTATHTDIDGFNKALDVSLALMEEFKTLTTESGTTII
ncbi:calcium-binding protein [Moraxella lacunata]|uniref:Dystroglycan-type cadherin-like domain-containing protein n=1 Tax=Moraxella lacunata TaxID=477 RepID=A0A1V4GVG4_MORLA|nr:calcium-binding protein [Moraxella lacunata]OPH36410.1 hypothetical protein B5J94_07415 [Moraxella lacunata]